MANEFYSGIATKTAIAVARQAANPKQIVTGEFIRQAWMEAGSGHGEKTLKGPSLTVFLKLAESGCIQGIPPGQYLRVNNNPRVGTENQDRAICLYAKIKTLNQWPAGSKPMQGYDDPIIWNDISTELGIRTIEHPRGCVAVIKGLFEAGLLN